MPAQSSPVVPPQNHWGIVGTSAPYLDHTGICGPGVVVNQASTDNHQGICL